MKSVSPTAATSARLLPNRRVLVTVASLTAAIALVRNDQLERVVGPIIDHAVVNIISLILGFRSWCRCSSGYGGRAATPPA